MKNSKAHYKWLLVVLLIALFLLVSTIAKGEDCASTLKLCDQAVTASQADNDALRHQLGIQQQYTGALEKQVKADANRTPGYVWLILGGLIGGTAGILLTK